MPSDPNFDQAFKQYLADQLAKVRSAMPFNPEDRQALGQYILANQAQPGAVDASYFGASGIPAAENYSSYLSPDFADNPQMQEQIARRKLSPILANPSIPAS